MRRTLVLFAALVVTLPGHADDKLHYGLQNSGLCNHTQDWAFTASYSTPEGGLHDVTSNFTQGMTLKPGDCTYISFKIESDTKLDVAVTDNQGHVITCEFHMRAPGRDIAKYGCGDTPQLYYEFAVQSAGDEHFQLTITEPGKCTDFDRAAASCTDKCGSSGCNHMVGGVDWCSTVCTGG